MNLFLFTAETTFFTLSRVFFRTKIVDLNNEKWRSKIAYLRSKSHIRNYVRPEETIDKYDKHSKCVVVYDRNGNAVGSLRATVKGIRDLPSENGFDVKFFSDSVEISKFCIHPKITNNTLITIIQGMLFLKMFFFFKRKGLEKIFLAADANSDAEKVYDSLGFHKFIDTPEYLPHNSNKLHHLMFLDLSNTTILDCLKASYYKKQSSFKMALSRYE